MKKSFHSSSLKNGKNQSKILPLIKYQVENSGVCGGNIALLQELSVERAFVQYFASLLSTNDLVMNIKRDILLDWIFFVLQNTAQFSIVKKLRRHLALSRNQFLTQIN